MATHSSILAWPMSWAEEPGGLQSMGLQRVGHSWLLLDRPQLMVPCLSGVLLVSLEQIIFMMFNYLEEFVITCKGCNMHVDILCGTFGQEKTNLSPVNWEKVANLWQSPSWYSSWQIHFSFHYVWKFRLLLSGFIRYKSLVKEKKNLLLKFLHDTHVYIWIQLLFHIFSNASWMLDLYL